MILVPAGTFTMGNGSSDAPIHKVYLDDYYIDKYDVTNLLYKACVAAGGCAQPHSLSSATHSDYYANSQYDNYPVINVDWNQAKAYCAWRGSDLPSEAQWEKAARGTDGRTYPWGEGIDTTFANYSDSKIGDTTAVGSYEKGKSPYGVYDMAGNVWQWVNDWYDANYYRTLGDNASNPQGPSSGQYRVLRGGSWGADNDLIRSALRSWYDPSNSNVNVGFRCSRSP